MKINSFGAELVLLGAVIATAILAIFLLFGGKMEFDIKCPPHDWQYGSFSSGCHHCGRRYGGGMFSECKKCGIREYSGNTTVHCSCEGAQMERPEFSRIHANSYELE